MGDVELARAIFRPGSVAVIGASSDPHKLGSRSLTLLQEMGFEGRLYPVNPRAAELYGLKAYGSVRDLPEPVDRVVISVPAPHVPAVLDDCIANGARVAQILTAGFGESGPAGVELERRLLERVRRGGLRLIGPNCVGTYSSRGRLSFVSGAPVEPGGISIASQSGGLCFDFLLRGGIQSLRFNNVVSVGNCVDLDLSDFLEFFRDDPDTTIIGLYVESVKDGGRFKDVLQKTTKMKPVVVLKGGRTGPGAESVASHTGNLAGAYDVWRTLFRQAGAIEVRTINEFINALIGLEYLRNIDVTGGMAILGNGGGATVLASDAAGELGVTIARPQPGTLRMLEALDLPGGAGSGNPLDLPASQLVAGEGRRFRDILNAYFCDPNISTIVFHFNLLSLKEQRDPLGTILNLVRRFEDLPVGEKAVVAVLRSHGEREIEELRGSVAQAVSSYGIPVFSTLDDAISTISLLQAYQRHRHRGDGV